MNLYIRYIITIYYNIVIYTFVRTKVTLGIPLLTQIPDPSFSPKWEPRWPLLSLANK